MGGGIRDVNTAHARSAAKKAAGQTTFHHSDTTKAKPPDQWTVHPSLDPKLKAGDQSPHAGQVMRECMITDEHPDPTAIACFFDVTGSMGTIPRVLQTKLDQLSGLLVRKGYCNDPQIMFGAIGDANTDRVPLQVGQFESDVAMDDNLENIFLEGWGGGQMHETYELGAYFLLNHTFLEPFEKHGKKGYAFFVGDERAYGVIRRSHVLDLIGDSLEADQSTADVFKALQERYHVFYIYAKEGSYSEEVIVGKTTDTEETWASLLGERAVVLDDAEAVSEFIATTVGLVEGGVTLDDALTDLADTGSSKKAIAATGKALAAVGGGTGGGVVATSTGDLPGLDEE